MAPRSFLRHYPIHAYRPWNHSHGREFNGFLDDIRVYSGALPVDEIQAIFKTRQAVPGVVAFSNTGTETETIPPHSPALENNHIVSKTLYEDAEDENIDGWMNYGPGLVKYISDQSGNRIISTIGDLAGDSFRLWKSDHKDWNNTEEFTAYFVILMEHDAAIYFRLETDQGEKYLCYIAGSSPGSENGATLSYGLGINADGNWHAIIRDLAKDLRDVLPNTQPISVKDMYVFGSAMLDDVMLLKVKE